MSFRKLLGKLFVFAVLELGAFTGVPMSLEEIEKLMNIMHRTKVVHVMKTEGGDGDQNGSSAVGP
ncbi:MAG TPA: hypothetical protein VN181_00965 [Thermoanaerobaculia bacterium]|nr:hypothetical protein [Thermoanaerobaculia bacterium]